ncbi:MAG: hypothetical protein M3443_05805 [Actinomycetota bacterium]|nr:hypothetical protein [Actinomycetota bacterium]
MLIKTMAARLAVYWLVFVGFFVLCQLLIARKVPDGLGVAVLLVAALPVAGVVTWRSRQGREEG